MRKKINTKNIIKILALGFIVVLCPALSWVYLQKGLNYQKEARKELIEKGSVNVANFIPDHLKENPKLLDNRLRVILFDIDKQNTKSNKQLVAKLVDQFEESTVVFLIEFISSKTNLKPLNKLENSMLVRKSIQFEELKSLINLTFGIPRFTQMDQKKNKVDISKNSIQKIEDYPFAVLVDQNDKIRNYYDLNNDSHIKRMVEHLAILIPRKDREKAELLREKEK